MCQVAGPLPPRRSHCLLLIALNCSHNVEVKPLPTTWMEIHVSVRRLICALSIGVQIIYLIKAICQTAAAGGVERFVSEMQSYARGSQLDTFRRNKSGFPSGCSAFLKVREHFAKKRSSNDLVDRPAFHL